MQEIKTITIADNEAYLRQISKEVDFSDKELKKDIKVLEEFCSTTDVMAMAAIQFGIPKRIIYLKNTNLELINKSQRNETTKDEENYNEARVLINPIILSSEGLTEYWEACYSCLDNFALVKRPYKIKVEYCDIKGEKHIEIFEGFPSTVLSHEIDHLDGILHMDIADEVLQMPREERKKFRRTHNYNIIAKTGDYKTLLEKIKKKEEKDMFNFNHVTISANNLEETLKFYYIFGFTMVKEYHDSEVDIIMLKLNNMILEIFHYQNNIELPEHSKDLALDLKTIGNKHFGLGVKNIEEAKKYIEENNLFDKKINITKGRLGKPYFFIKDPNGILMEIIEED